MKLSGKNHISFLTRLLFFFIFFTLSYFTLLPSKIEAACCTINSDCVSGSITGTCNSHSDTNCPNLSCSWNGVDPYCCSALNTICMNNGQQKTCQQPTLNDSVAHPQCTFVCSGNGNVTGNNNFICLCTDNSQGGVHSWRCLPANITCSSGNQVDYSKCPSVSSTNQSGTYNCIADIKKGEGEICFNNLECDIGLSCLPIDPNNLFSDKICKNPNFQSSPIPSNGPRVDPTIGCTNAINTALGCIPYEYQAFVPALLGFLATIIGAIALVVMLIGTITIMTASGNPEAVKKGKELFTGAITGLLFIIFSVVILKMVAGDIIKLPGFIK